METRGQSIAEGCHTVSKRSEKTSENGKEDSLPLLPIDLTLEIFTRSPAKSLGMFRCVSKLWASVIGSPYFTDLFSAKSSARPRILFVCSKRGTYKTSLFSLPQLQSADEYSYPLVVDRIAYCPLHDLVEHINLSLTSRIGCLLGFVHYVPYFKGKMITRHVICNPLTGRSLTLPKVGGKASMKWVDSQLVYDPVEKQFKILSMTKAYGTLLAMKYKVLALGTEETKWRRIECGMGPHRPYFNQGICINGVLYYLAKNWMSGTDVMVCFDVRYEKFSSFDVKEPYEIRLSTGELLIVYNDKLAVLQFQHNVFGYVEESSRSFELIVIGDFEKQEWSKHTYIIPSSWKTTVNVGGCFLSHLKFVGVTQTNEIVLRLSRNEPNPICLFFYNMERGTFTRVEINGMNDVAIRHIFLDYVEDLKFIGS